MNETYRMLGREHEWTRREHRVNRNNNLKHDGISTLTTRIVVLLVVVAATAPPALAGALRSSGGQLSRHTNVATAQCPCNVGLPGRPVADLSSSRYGPTDGWYSYVVSGAFTQAHDDLGAASLTWASSSDCPCNVGLPGGPAAAGHATLVSATVSGSGGRFDWGAAGVGAGFTAGLALLAAAATLVLRRHRAFAGPYS